MEPSEVSHFILLHSMQPQLIFQILRSYLNEGLLVDEVVDFLLEVLEELDELEGLLAEY